MLSCNCRRRRGGDAANVPLSSASTMNTSSWNQTTLYTRPTRYAYSRPPELRSSKTARSTSSRCHLLRKFEPTSSVGGDDVVEAALDIHFDDPLVGRPLASAITRGHMLRRICSKAPWQPRPGRNPYDTCQKHASKIASRMFLTAH